ncbi:hypothetical protein [Aurantiacibacter sp. MUD61]|uniref:hypothetical protein n=1 Tax=Aurantiacibacter sp. MUD61 TaxID=3009083 RepID=UPI0022F0CFDF|nr:hypothetical protein [Aurantiacibacter sp. MUD61]
MKTIWKYACASVLAAISAGPAFASSGETEIVGRLEVLDQCPVHQASQSQTESLIGTILAGVVGGVAEQALSGLSDAIRRASQEHAYTASDSTSYFAGTLHQPTESPARPWRYTADAHCLVFFVPSSGGDDWDNFEAALLRDTGLTNADITALTAAASEDDSTPAGVFAQYGFLDNTPRAYFEIRVQPTPEGTHITPVTAWYGASIANGSSRTRPAELLVELALPANAENQDLGAIYSVARMRLPNLRPNRDKVYNAADLSEVSEIFYPNAPAEGYPASRVNALNAIDQRGVTAQIEMFNALVGLHSLQAATTRDPTKIAVAEGRIRVARAALAAAEAESCRLRGVSYSPLGTVSDPAQFYDAVFGASRCAPQPRDDQGEPTSGLHRSELGATNARVSFIVVRRPSRFGIAVADVLSGQSEALGTAVTGALTPESEFTTAQTTYATKLAAAQSAEAAYYAAAAGDDAAATAAARSAMIGAMAAANEAAAAVGEPLPYPNVMSLLMTP